MSNFNWVDYVVLAIFVLSIMAGLARGVIKEVIAVITWIAAFIISILFSARLASAFTNSSTVQDAINNATTTAGVNPTQSISMLSLGLSFISLFVATLIVGSLINFVITRVIEGQGVSITNHLFGGVFGILRGLLIILALMFLVQLTPLQEQPWWTQSRFVSTFQPAVNWLQQATYPEIQKLKSSMTNTITNVETGVEQQAQPVTQPVQSTVQSLGGGTQSP